VITCVTNMRRGSRSKRGACRNGLHLVEVRFLVRVGCSFELCPLDFCSLHAFAQERLATEEQFMIVRTSIRSSRNPLVPVQVKLPLERSQLCLAEVVRKYRICKVLRFVDHEAPAVWLPAADVTITIRLDPFQDRMEPQWEAHGDTTPTTR